MQRWRTGCTASVGGWDAIWLATEGEITPIPDYIYCEVEKYEFEPSHRKSQQLSLSVYELAMGHIQVSNEADQGSTLSQCTVDPMNEILLVLFEHYALMFGVQHLIVNNHNYITSNTNRQCREVLNN